MKRIDGLYGFMVVTAFGFLVSTAQGGDDLKVPLPPAATPETPLNIQVIVTPDRVLDQRHFEDQPKTADIPSLAGGMERAGTATTVRAIGRARNAYGKAMQNLYVDEGGTVQQVMAEAVGNILRSAGYTVVTDPSRAAPSALVADVVIHRFWGWMEVPGGRIFLDDSTITMLAEIETEIGLTTRGGKRQAVTVTAKASSRQGLRYMANWEKTFRLMMEEYARNGVERLRSGAAAAGAPAAVAPAATPAVPPPEATGPTPAATRLRELQKLKDEGLITDREYQQKRQALIDQL